MEGLVMDNGSESLKVGLVGDDDPQTVFSVVGRPKSKAEKDFFVGADAQSRRDLLDLTYPIERGIITHWDHMEKLWHHALFRELKTKPQELRVLLAEAPNNPKAVREKTAQVMFEAFSVPALTLTNQGALSLFSTGRTSGVVMECGAGVTHVVPVHQGFAVAAGVQSLELAGRDLTEHLLKLLTERGCSFSSAAQWDVVQDIKEKLCYLPLSFKTEMMKEPSSVETNYQLPDGSTVAVGNERFRCPEVLLQPSLIGRDCPGLHKAAFDSVMKCKADIHKDLWKNLVVSGGSSLFPGLAERLTNEITALKPSSAVKVVAPDHRRFCAWRGGTILCGLPSDERWISRADFQEVGPNIVTRKCPLFKTD